MSNLNVIGDGKIYLGQSCSVSPSAQFIFNKNSTITVGDYCTIGPGVKIVCSGGDVVIGDWTTLHDNCLVLSGKVVSIGQHCWFGQNCIIDGTGGIYIGQGVRVGMYSQLWSHVAAGEQIEGCTLYGEREVKIEDDVWLVGSCIASSGVTIGKRTVALIGSNITKSFPANSTLAGAPAVPKSTLTFYKEITLNEKWRLITEWLESECANLNFSVDIKDDDLIVVRDGQELYSIIFARTTERAELSRREQANTTTCCIEDKSYIKKFTPIEKRVLKFLSGNKARFYSK